MQFQTKRGLVDIPNNYDHFKAQLEELDRQGFLRFAAMPEYLNPLLSRIKAARPKIRVVRGVGSHAVEQYIFLPHGRRYMISKFRHDLLYADRVARNTRRALNKLGITA